MHQNALVVAALQFAQLNPTLVRTEEKKSGWLAVYGPTHKMYVAMTKVAKRVDLSFSDPSVSRPLEKKNGKIQSHLRLDAQDAALALALRIVAGLEPVAAPPPVQSPVAEFAQAAALAADESPAPSPVAETDPRDRCNLNDDGT